VLFDYPVELLSKFRITLFGFVLDRLVIVVTSSYSGLVLVLNSFSFEIGTVVRHFDLLWLVGADWHLDVTIFHRNTLQQLVRIDLTLLKLFYFLEHVSLLLLDLFLHELSLVK
jgi:hypothetical protein